MSDDELSEAPEGVTDPLAPVDAPPPKVIAGLADLPRRKRTMDEFIRLCISEGRRIQLAQRALVESAVRAVPDAGQLDLAATWFDLARMLHRLEPCQEDIRELTRRKRMPELDLAAFDVV